MQFTTLALADGEATGAAMAGYRQTGVRTGLGAGTEVRVRRRDGTEFIAEMTLWPIGAGDGAIFNAFVTDITDRKRREQAVQHLAFNDPLTGLPNRAHFEECLGAALATVDAAGAGAAGLLFIDIDRFKHVNDTMG